MIIICLHYNVKGKGIKIKRNISVNSTSMHEMKLNLVSNTSKKEIKIIYGGIISYHVIDLLSEQLKIQ